MKLQIVPARQGVLWVRQGFRAFFRHPMAFSALFAAFMFVVFLLALVPVLGALLVLALLPLVSLAFMIATRIVNEGGFPTPRVFIEPLRAQRPSVVALLQLGVIYAVATFGVMWLSDVVDGGAFEALMDALPAGKSAPDAVATKALAPGLLWGLLLRLGMTALLSVPFWHAPALVHWDGQGSAQALFSSTLACWRNRGAFAAYSLTWFALIVTVGVVGSVVFSMVGQAPMFAVAAVPMSLLFTTVFYASLYFTFADCFVDGKTGSVIDSP